MTRIRIAACVFVLVVVSLASLVAHGQRDDPSPQGKDANPPLFPKQCEGFLRTERTRLLGVWGHYQQIAAILATAFSPDRRYALMAGTREALPDVAE